MFRFSVATSLTAAGSVAAARDLSPTPVVDQRGADRDTLRVVTLNVAHGRGDSRHQLLLTRATVQSNVRNVAALLERHAPDVVALQEADGPSWWSGGFDHVREVARQAGLRWHFRGEHAQGWLYDYGTALLSRLPLHATQSLRFDPTPLTPRKGLVIGEVDWPDPATEQRVAVVSVHFDFLSRSARRRQYEQLAARLEAHKRPVIVLGDFNSGWTEPDSPVRRLAERIGLHGFEPTADALATHGGQRIDWMLVSPEFRFARYEVLPDIVSDHLAVMAELRLGGRDAAS